MKRRDRRALATQVALEGFRRFTEHRERKLRAAGYTVTPVPAAVTSATGRVILPDLDWAFRVLTAIGRGAGHQHFLAELVDLGQAQPRRGSITPFELDLMIDAMWQTVLVAAEEIEARRAGRR